MAGNRVISAVLTLKDKNFASGVKSAANSTRDMERRIQSTGNSVRNFSRSASDSFKGVAVGAAGLVAAFVGLNTIKNVAVGAIEAASSLEGYRNTLNVVMGDHKKAAETMAWANDFANKTPFETESVVEATVRLASYGLEAKKVLPAIGDMAAVMNKDVMQATEAVADAQTGELERMKEFGITKTMIEKKAGEMFKGQMIINKKGQIVEQEKFNEAMFALMGDKFSGGMETQSKSFKGVMSNITGTWKTGLATMAGISASGDIVKGGLFDTLKEKASGLSTYMAEKAADGTFEAFGKKIGDGLTTGIEKVGQIKDKLVEMYTFAKPGLDYLKDTAFPAIGSAIGTVVTEVTAMYNFFANNMPLIAPIVAGLTASLLAYKIGVIAMTAATKLWAVATTAQTVIMGLLNGTLLISPLGWIVIAIGAVVAIGVILYQNWDTIKAGAISLWSTLKEKFSGIKSSVMESLEPVISFFDRLLGKWNDFKSAISSFKMPKLSIPSIAGIAGKVAKTIIPGFAKGTNYAPGGIAQINERGGEIVDLPNGSRVYPHDKSVQMARSEGKNISFGDIIIQGANMTVEQIANELVLAIKSRLANI